MRQNFKHSKLKLYTVSRKSLCMQDLMYLSVVSVMFQIRFYPRSTKLDNTFAHITKIPSQVLLLNTFRDIVIVLCGDCHIMMYHVTRKNGQSASKYMYNQLLGDVAQMLKIDMISLTNTK